MPALAGSRVGGTRETRTAHRHGHARAAARAASLSRFRILYRVSCKRNEASIGFADTLNLDPPP